MHRRQEADAQKTGERGAGGKRAANGAGRAKVGFVSVGGEVGSGQEFLWARRSCFSGLLPPFRTHRAATVKRGPQARNCRVLMTSSGPGMRGPQKRRCTVIHLLTQAGGCAVREVPEFVHGGLYGSADFGSCPERAKTGDCKLVPEVPAPRCAERRRCLGAVPIRWNLASEGGIVLPFPTRTHRARSDKAVRSAPAK